MILMYSKKIWKKSYMIFTNKRTFLWGAGQPHKLIGYIGGDFLLFEKENLKHFSIGHFTNSYKYLYLYYQIWRGSSNYHENK